MQQTLLLTTLQKNQVEEKKSDDATIKIHQISPLNVFGLQENVSVFFFISRKISRF
jgi:hypothetical protein